ncbi:MAG TPA: hypothetical protein VFP55_00070, partial [Solirubrobacteraceae bacterium]|nr:hypothetical protein [Solirubrobacteraceae bacterium]
MTSPKEMASWVDARAGDGVEALVRLKHRRRLHRLHQAEALEPGAGWWAAGDPPPREGCSLEVFVDGADYFAAVAEAIGQARHSIHITGWHLAPSFQLARGRDPLVLGEALAEAAERPELSGKTLDVAGPERTCVNDLLDRFARL